MTLVSEYRASLLRLQGAWDLLALLGPMSGIGSEIGQTRDDFHRLSDALVASLARQLLQQRLQFLLSRAQVTIDILVRNLFERTADVGFLASDAPLRDFLQAVGEGGAPASQRQALQARFGDYVRKYSVYDDIIVLAADGRVLARLDTDAPLERSRDALIAAALRPGVPFVERFAASDLSAGRPGLFYAAAIGDALGRPAGVLCLSFRFEDEMRGVFARLLADADGLAVASGDGTVLALVDGSGAVLISSDRWQFPVGAPLPGVAPGGGLLRFAGREYLAVAAHSGGYQGYPGPPSWQAVALIPVDLAFPAPCAGGNDERVDADDPGPVLALLARSIDAPAVFDAESLAIPAEAQLIQRELARAVWNGTLAPLRTAAAASSAPPSAFTHTFLQEVSRTGAQIRDVFDGATSRLQVGAIVAILDNAESQARLAIDIRDRNLYERANDCRWWALTPALREALAAPGPAALERAAQVLQHINGLYTVYSLLVLFDVGGAIVAVSDPERGDLLGTSVDAELAQATLALRDPERHHAGRQAPTALYGGKPTCVFAAAVQKPPLERSAGEPSDGSTGAAALGGIAIVFDGLPQFEAMLRDALPRIAAGEPLAGAVGLFASRAGSVLASTDPRFAVAAVVPFDTALLDLRRGAATRRVIEIEGTHYAAGISQGSGYREYRPGREESPDDVAAVLLLPLGRTTVSAQPAPVDGFFTPRHRPGGTAAGAAGRLQVASFTLGGAWFGLPAEEIEEVLAAVTPMGLPKAPVHLAGLLQHRGRVVPVLDPGSLLAGRAALADGPLLLCRTGDGQPIVLRVDTLGAVFELDADQLLPWQAAAGGRKLRLLSGECAGVACMLTLLSIDTLRSAGASMADLGESTSAPRACPA